MSPSNLYKAIILHQIPDLMQSTRYILPVLPAAADLVATQLYNQDHIDKDVKNLLTNNLISQLKEGQIVKVLILGGRCGLVAEILLPYCSQIDIVEQDPYVNILEERFIKRKEVDYFFGREGFIGNRHISAAPHITNQTVRVIRAEKLKEEVEKEYSIILVQNSIITAESNLIQQLINVGHDQLITMMIPGKIDDPKLFHFFALFEQNIIGTFYTNLFHGRLQNRRFITGRREEIIYYEIFIWKRNELQLSEEKVRNLLKIDELEVGKGDSKTNPYENKSMVDTYINFHYGEQYFGIENFPLKCAEICINEAKKHKLQGRALDLGCAVGRSTVELAQYFHEAVGLDYSAAFINAANDILKEKYHSVESKVKFVVGDACNLQTSLGKFDLIFGGNLIDRLPDPAAFVNSITDFLEPNGILILTSPYSWLSEYTNPQKWLGGIIQNGVQIPTPEGLRRILQKKGLKQLRESENIRFVIKVNDWVYMYTLANATYWIKSA